MTTRHEHDPPETVDYDDISPDDGFDTDSGGLPHRRRDDLPKPWYLTVFQSTQIPVILVVFFTAGTIYSELRSVQIWQTSHLEYAREQVNIRDRDFARRDLVDARLARIEEKLDALTEELARARGLRERLENDNEDNRPRRR